jgi:hypothetical protein
MRLAGNTGHLIMATGFHKPSQTTPPLPIAASEDLPLFRFRLRQLLAVVTFLSLLMAALVLLGGPLAMALVMVTLVVALHVLGTALGTQLRSRAKTRQSLEPSVSGAIHCAGSPTTRGHEEHRRRSPWHQRRSTPLPWLARLIAVAFVIGGVLGAVFLSVTVGRRTSPAGVAVGAFSIAVVAGWFTFVGYSFYGVFRHGVQDAMANDPERK